MRGVRSVAGVGLSLGLAVAGLGCGSAAADPVQAAQADVKALDKAVRDYCIKKGEYPESLQVLVDEEFLVADGLRDPWRKRYQYDLAGAKNKGKKPDIWTVTPNRQTIGNWSRGKK
jgi:hypothetical protein